MRYLSGKNHPEDYHYLDVREEQPLLEFLLANLKGISHSKIKATLKGKGVKVNGKVSTQFDLPLKPGYKVSVSKRKRTSDLLISRYVKIVYEDQYLVVIEKNVGILSMAADRKSTRLNSSHTS